MFKGTMTKWPVQKRTQGTTPKLLQHHDATDNVDMLALVIIFPSIFVFVFNTFVRDLR